MCNTSFVSVDASSGANPSVSIGIFTSSYPIATNMSSALDAYLISSAFWADVLTSCQTASAQQSECDMSGASLRVTSSAVLSATHVDTDLTPDLACSAGEQCLAAAGALTYAAVTVAYVQKGGNVSIGGVSDLYALTCVTGSSITWLDASGQQHTSQVPMNITMLFGTTSHVIGSVTCTPVSEVLNNNAPTHRFVHCTSTYQECIDSDPTESGWATADCPSFEGTFCIDCHHAGEITYLAIVVNCFSLVLLVYIYLVRSSAALDGRCYKFWVTPLTIIACSSIACSTYIWKTQCFHHMNKSINDFFASSNDFNTSTATMDELIDRYYINGLEPETDLHRDFYMPLVLMSCVLVVWFINLITPVPENFSSFQCADSERREREMCGNTGETPQLCRKQEVSDTSFYSVEVEEPSEFSWNSCSSDDSTTEDKLESCVNQQL